MSRNLNRALTTLALTNGQLVDALGAMKALEGQPMRHPTSYYASFTLAQLEAAARVVGDAQERLLRQYADRNDGKPVRASLGNGLEGYVVRERSEEYQDAKRRLMEEAAPPLRVYTFTLADFDFQLPAPEGREARRPGELEPERINFLDVIPPAVWKGLHPLMTDNPDGALEPVHMELADVPMPQAE